MIFLFIPLGSRNVGRGEEVSVKGVIRASKGNNMQLSVMTVRGARRLPPHGARGNPITTRVCASTFTGALLSPFMQWFLVARNLLWLVSVALQHFKTGPEPLLSRTTPLKDHNQVGDATNSTLSTRFLRRLSTNNSKLQLSFCINQVSGAVWQPAW